MKNIQRKLIEKMPKPLRRKMTQSFLEFPDSLPGLQFKVAESIDEFEQASRVLHDSYVSAGFMDSHHEGLRIIPQFFLPSTAIMIAKEGDRVIGTMSHIRDNALGLPMEKLFDLGSLRDNGTRLTEVSSLALHPDYRKKGGLIFHQFIRFAWNFSLDYHGGETFVIAVNPSMVQFYEDLYLFEQLPIKSHHKKYDFVKGAPAVGLYTQVDSKTKIHKEYANKKTEKNLYEFMFGNNQIYNGILNSYSNEFYDINSPGATTEVLEHFLLHNNSWWHQLDPLTQHKFARVQLALGRYNLCYPGFQFKPAERNESRFDASLKIISNDTRQPSIYDLSLNGLKTRNLKFDPSISSALIACQVGPEKTIRLKLEPIWTHQIFAGFSIKDADSDWIRFVEHINRKINPENPLSKQKSR